MSKFQQTYLICMYVQVKQIKKSKQDCAKFEMISNRKSDLCYEHILLNH